MQNSADYIQNADGIGNVHEAKSGPKWNVDHLLKTFLNCWNPKHRKVECVRIGRGSKLPEIE